ncbi:hypothetical protein BDP27DRAFT_1452754 [Rhodocollybia butyracea]|uniref:Uncharacterized protein n=1 Tax=Rhodocollybia butyracea TaxID=206335 RepID=A0A9P5TZI7_9AGAR|nr:hypothetical protein BDP27DRAFT_1452754 [Rhodocollybia butyracea]
MYLSSSLGVAVETNIPDIVLKESGLQVCPKIKYKGSPAAVFVGHLTDESLKSAAYISSRKTWIADMWTWYEKPGNDLRLIRFSSAMKGSGDRFPPDKIIIPDSVIVDVGGGEMGWQLQSVHIDGPLA